MNRPGRATAPTYVALVYLILGLAWIWSSDFYLVVSGIQPLAAFWKAVAKGSGFVVCSAALIYWLIRRSFAELVRSETLLSAVAQGTTDAVFVKDRDGRYLFANDACARFVGVAAETILGQDDTAFFDPESARIVQERDRAVMDNGFPETKEEVLTAAGATRVYLAGKAPYRDADGRVIGIVGISRDVTATRRAEERLREKDAQLHAADHRLAELVRGMSEACFELDGDWHFRFVNDRFQTLLLTKREEMLGRSIWEVFSPLNGTPMEAHYRRAMAERVPVAFEAFSPIAHRWLDIRAFPSENGLAVFLLDIHDRKLLESQVRQAQKMEAIGRLAGGVAHDFNNLLTVVNGYGDLLLETLTPEDPSFAPIAAIRRAGDRAARLTRQLLSFSRKAILEPKLLSFVDLVTDSARLLRRLIGEDIALTVDADPATPKIHADAGQIEQVIMNLVLNARDAMPTGGRLTLATRAAMLDASDQQRFPQAKPGLYAELTVVDTGIGMSKETLAVIFEPFFTTKGVGAGTGLGLAVVHGVIEQCGGAVAVTSELGRGTEFRVLLPAAGAMQVAASEADSAPSRRGSETVLIVEDEEQVRTIARVALEAHGYRVLTASDGAAALGLMRKHTERIHLVICDVVMPGMGGRQVAESVRAEHPTVKILYISGYTDDAVVRHGIVEGRDAFLPKPFTPLSLTRKAREVLDGHN